MIMSSRSVRSAPPRKGLPLASVILMGLIILALLLFVFDVHRSPTPSAKQTPGSVSQNRAATTETPGPTPQSAPKGPNPSKQSPATAGTWNM
jgi:hypothetical protein